MKIKLGIFVCLILLISCSVPKKFTKTELSSRPYKEFYVVDTITIEDPIIIVYQKMIDPVFVCSKANLDEIINDKYFYKRSDVYILEDTYSAISYDNPIIFELEKNECGSEYLKDEKDFRCLRFVAPVKFALALVLVAKTNKYFSSIMYEWDTKPPKLKQYSIKAECPDLLYNRVLFPICEGLNSTNDNSH